MMTGDYPKALSGGTKRGKPSGKSQRDNAKADGGKIPFAAWTETSAGKVPSVVRGGKAGYGKGDTGGNTTSDKGSPRSGKSRSK